MTSNVAAPAGKAPRSAAGLRADIQGLRALAVLLVVIFHLWPEQLRGGYIGVDVFFVISGFLITSHLMRELTATGHVRLGRFWARRAVRLLPAAFLVILVSAIAVIIWVPTSLQKQFLIEGGGAALYVVNWVLAASAVDYLAADNVASPFQHYWTLSAEEQFYIGIPLLLLLAAVLFRRHRQRAVAAALGLAAAASLGYGIWLTITSPAVAYFSTATRAWEFAAGGLLSLVTITVSARVREVLAIVGVVGIVASAFILTEDAAFPGWVALLPVVPTLLVLYAGEGTYVDRASRWRPIRFYGDVSYSMYLWHWPLIILLPYITGHPLEVWEKVAIFVASTVLAWVSLRFVEDPVRFTALLAPVREPRAAFSAMAIGMAVICLVSLGGMTVATQRTAAMQAEAEKTLTADEIAQRCYGAAALDPELDCPAAPLGDVLFPDPAATTDLVANNAACWSRDAETEVKVCTLGPESGYTKTLLAVGDSHNNALINAYGMIADALNWRIEVTGHNACYWTTRQQEDSLLDRQQGCDQWKINLESYLNDHEPFDAIITTHSAMLAPAAPINGETPDEATVNGMVEAWATQTARGTKILAIRDNPVQRTDVKSCVDANRDAPNEACAASREEALKYFDGSAEAVTQTPGATLIDLTPYECTDTICPVVIGSAVVYNDSHHLTDPFARSLAPYIQRAAVAAIGQ